MTPAARSPCAGHRFRPEVIGHAVWLYFRFPLGLRMVEEMLAARGIIVSHETVRQWARKFGQAFANQVRRRLPRPGDKWHVDEVAIPIAGEKHWSWRAVDQDGMVLDVLVQSRRDKRARRAPAPQAAVEAEAAAARHGHRQAGELSRGEAETDVQGRAPPARGSEQPGPELAPADEVTRTADEAVQIRRSGAAISLGHD